MTRHIRISPITRLEGHGTIDILLDDDGNVADAFFQVVELRGFDSGHSLGSPQVEAIAEWLEARNGGVND